MSKELDCIQPGDSVGPYRILRGFKGRGGMARIFAVEVREKYRQPAQPRRMALKVAKPGHQAALKVEADFLSRFDHPGVVRIFPLPGHHRPVYAARERFAFGWGWYYAMELLDGGSLEHRLTHPTTIDTLFRRSSGEGCCLSVIEALGVARQLAAALEHIHRHQVINLDIKPGNVLFRRRRFSYLRGSVPRAVMCDFGIARDLRFSPRFDVLGMVTPEYTSPEQALEKSHHQRPLDVRSDIFSLGILLYEMLTGELPFERMAQLIDPAYAPPPPHQLRPTVPPPLSDVVLRALAKEPDQRFQRAAEMCAALEQVSSPFDWMAAARRMSAAAAVGAGLVICLAAGGYGAVRTVDYFSTTATPADATIAPADPAVSPPRYDAPRYDAPRSVGTPTNAVKTCTPVPTGTPTPVLIPTDGEGD